mmetsp:Transcript_23487/g.30521  ORF Transcript_23487/g.30521 Transcript_23487/m.30521 type:complete len:447 (+) Transcript_23487:116-1456(+)|eukprot:CAMPEP_0197296018 /NCGR_PEP_ID=MMETSP0890-20130614/37268_1 /TAXON_ID=44058 ORGANISM="Aureoumbra lagunensis, Strain CCMP1510" /NCGR_SAMPLE_ID=MMETSP0890 /ASSEMBLY_ACC=CAM_ASM_000533 /LENGTH=446 /DNA_ID=CAMNT_0042772327 /DNA_START=41 /DNA_END=1381 /DNA_ORIENTATION=-
MTTTPLEVIRSVTSYLSPIERLVVRRVCEIFRQAAMLSSAERKKLEVTLCFAGRDWELGEGDTARKLWHDESIITFRTFGDVFDRFQFRKSDFQFNADITQPLLGALGTVRSINIHGASSEIISKIFQGCTSHSILSDRTVEIVNCSLGNSLHKTAIDVVSEFSELVPGTTYVSWWNHDIPMDIASCIIGNFRNLASLRLILSGDQLAEWRSESIDFFEALPDLVEIEVIATSTALPDFNNGDTSFVPHSNSALKRLALLPQVREIKFPDLAVSSSVVADAGAELVAAIILQKPRISHLSELPLSSRFWTTLNSFFVESSFNESSSRKGERLHLQVSGEYSYLKDLDALVDCLIDPHFPSIPIHLELRIDVLVLLPDEDDENHFGLFETDINIHNIIITLARLGQLSDNPQVTIETNIPDFVDTYSYLESALSEHGVDLLSLLYCP